MAEARRLEKEERDERLRAELAARNADWFTNQHNDLPAEARAQLDAMAETPYDPTTYQPVLFVAPSFTRMLVDLTIWVRTGGWRL